VTTKLARRDLRLLHTLLWSSRDPEVPRLQETLRALIAERAGEREWETKVFEIRLPISAAGSAAGKKAGGYFAGVLAPTLNVYGSMKPWQRAKLYKDLDLRILAELARWPHCLLRGEKRKRAVRVTRASSSIPDEITVDIIGGKVVVDRMVLRDILAGDSGELLEREALWVQVPPKKGSLLVEVFELGLASQ
jgi:hypothetical protein